MQKINSPVKSSVKDAVESLGPSAEDVLNMSNNFAKLYLSKLVELLDEEDQMGTFGKDGWRQVLFGAYPELKDDGESSPPKLDAAEPVTAAIN